MSISERWKSTFVEPNINISYAYGYTSASTSKPPHVCLNVPPPTVMGESNLTTRAKLRNCTLSPYTCVSASDLQLGNVDTLMVFFHQQRGFNPTHYKPATEMFTHIWALNIVQLKLGPNHSFPVADVMALRVKKIVLVAG
ncbi:hypothetical protein CHS0354_042580, partial [Potamilus streckersoni]